MRQRHLSFLCAVGTMYFWGGNLKDHQQSCNCASVCHTKETTHIILMDRYIIQFT